MLDIFSGNIKIEDLDLATRLFEESRAGFLHLFDNSPICMSMTTPERRYARVNKKFLEKFGFTEPEIIGRTSAEVGILDDDESVRVGMILKEKGRLQNDYVKCKTRDGSIVHTVSSIERMVFNGTPYLVSHFLDITKIVEQQAIIEQQHKDINDSIHYASRIQHAILPTHDEIGTLVSEFFVIYKPRNVVSGDFYAVFEKDRKIIIAAADCTGHGVPGAFMSMIGNDQLNHIIVEKGITHPSAILNELNRAIKKALRQNTHRPESIDGMDIAICSIDRNNQRLHYAGAMRPLFFAGDQFLEIKADRMGIGGYLDNDFQFTSHALPFKNGDTFYLSSDGYGDQFGGAVGKKFTTRRLRDTLEMISKLPLKAQEGILVQEFEKWKTGYDQVDDVLVLGVRL